MLNTQLEKSFLLLILIASISGCNLLSYPARPTIVPTPSVTLQQISATPILPTNTPVPIPTATATTTPTPVWLFQSGTITCPILLYHRIAEPPLPNSIDARYYMPPEDFKWQMQALKDWGYSTIPMSLLVAAITKGALLPPRPVVISFDDGYETVVENAFPIMQKFGFTGILYIVGNYVGAQGYMSVDQLTMLVGSGWEIGSHSMSHPKLSSHHDLVNFEAGHSKGLLASEIGTIVETFAYPYGDTDSFVDEKVAEYGYLAAVGLGTQYVHSLTSLYYLSRIEVQNGTNQAAFAALLPWSGQP